MSLVEMPMLSEGTAFVRPDEVAALTPLPRDDGVVGTRVHLRAGGIVVVAGAPHQVASYLGYRVAETKRMTCSKCSEAAVTHFPEPLCHAHAGMEQDGA